jgi:uncharacterized protein YdiU (UPF0061 family)
MRKQILTIFTVLGLALALNTASAQSSKDDTTAKQLRDIEKQLNQKTQTTKQWQAAMHTISVETGVPQDQLRAMKKGHPEVQPAGILIASVLADETKKAPEDLLKQHLSGQNWPAVARNNNVPFDKLTQRLQKVLQAIPGAKS